MTVQHTVCINLGMYLQYNLFIYYYSYLNLDGCTCYDYKQNKPNLCASSNQDARPDLLTMNSKTLYTQLCVIKIQQKISACV